MAYWIDRALIWLLAAFSALVFFLVLTDGRFVLSVLLAFAVVLLLRAVLQKLPEKRPFSRKRRLAQIESLLRKWAIAEKQEALAEIRSLLPDLFESSSDLPVCFIQRLPDSEELTANHLLEIRRAHKQESSVFLLCTGPVSPSALSLADSLSHPLLRISDSRQLTRLLLRSPCALPEITIKKERRRPFPVCVAQWTHSIRPIRSTVYAFVFFILYQLTRSRFYLASSLFFCIQLMICLISRTLEARTA